MCKFYFQRDIQPGSCCHHIKIEFLKIVTVFSSNLMYWDMFIEIWLRSLCYILQHKNSRTPSSRGHVTLMAFFNIFIYVTLSRNVKDLYSCIHMSSATQWSNIKSHTQPRLRYPLSCHISWFTFAMYISHFPLSLHLSGLTSVFEHGR